MALPGAVAARARYIYRRCDNVFCSTAWVAGRRLAMNSVHGWFSDNKGWIEFIVAAVVLWLLMMTGISLFDLRSVG